MNGYVESFNGKLRDELSKGELFLYFDELRYVADRWRMDYDRYRQHSSLDYMTPVAFAAKRLEQGNATLRFPQDKENLILWRMSVIKRLLHKTNDLPQQIENDGPALAPRPPLGAALNLPFSVRSSPSAIPSRPTGC